MDKVLTEFLTKVYALADQLGIQAARVWPQIVGITFVQSLVWSVLDVIFPVVVLVVVAKLSPKCMAWAERQTKGGHYEPDFAGFGYGAVILLWVVAFGFCMIFLGDLSNSLPGVLFPEAQTILKLAKNIK